MTPPTLGSLLVQWEQAYARGQELPVELLCPECPELAVELARCIEALRRLPPRPAAAAPGPPCSPAVPETVNSIPTTRVPDFPGDAGLPAPLRDSPPGYELLGELGRGGMGIVYKARQLRLNRVVALKMILVGGHARTEDRVRFFAEAEAIAAVKHPGIVQVFEFGTHNGLPFFSLEFCAGGSLAGKLNNTPLPAAEAARVMERVARSIQEAHERGVIHRDLKPGNILLLEDGSPKVTDFGLAKRLDAGAGMTETGSVMGTPSYMAPEQARGQKGIGPAADTYALGAILYECLTGRPPFRAATPMETLVQVVNEEPALPRQLNREVPPDMEVICLKCLEKEPGRRYATAGELAEDLRRWQTGEPIAARRAGRMERASKWVRRRPLAAALLAVSVLAAVALAALSLVAVQEWRTAVAALNSERAARAREDQERSRRQRTQVEALLTADPRAVPALLENVSGRSGALPWLRQVWNEPDSTSTRPRRMRAALALLAAEPTAVQHALVDWALEVADPAELLLIRERLQKYGRVVPASLWSRGEQPETTPSQRLRLLALLAAFDPDGPDWKTAGEKILEPWLEDNPLYLGTWTEALRPARAALVGPLTAVFRGRLVPRRRLVAASILADFARDRPETLARLIAEASERQFTALLPALERSRSQALPLLRREFAAAAETGGDGAAQRRAGASLALLRLGEADPVWPVLKRGPDPEARSRLLHRLASGGVEATAVTARLERETDVSVRRSLILALGEYAPRQLSDGLRQRLIPRLLAWYRDDPDAGIHSAIDWLLRPERDGPEPRPLVWGQRKALERIDAERRGKAMPRGWNWYVGRTGQTMSVLRNPAPFRMGSPGGEEGRFNDETAHQHRIDRDFALATRSVTVAQFQRFLQAHPEVHHSYKKKFSPEPDCPIISVMWYEAAQYCRWLSEQEGVPEEQMCYPSVAVIEKYKDGRRPLRLPRDYLKRTGYRLPTEAEWEYACRAGARTPRYFGSSDELLPRYAWYALNARERTWPVGQKKPNDFGLFDMHGNAWNWCQERYRPYKPGTPERPTSDEPDASVDDTMTLVVRGVSFGHRPSFVRAALRGFNRPAGRNYGPLGLRVARTHR